MLKIYTNLDLLPKSYERLVHEKWALGNYSWLYVHKSTNLYVVGIAGVLVGQPLDTVKVYCI